LPALFDQLLGSWELVSFELVLESPAITDAAGISVTPRLRWRRIN
jgi:hypothetical protein